MMKLLNPLYESGWQWLSGMGLIETHLLCYDCFSLRQRVEGLMPRIFAAFGR